MRERQVPTLKLAPTEVHYERVGITQEAFTLPPKLVERFQLAHLLLVSLTHLRIRHLLDGKLLMLFLHVFTPSVEQGTLF
jgi:hypothetical protein